jgi:hypothetical protein
VTAGKRDQTGARAALSAAKAADPNSFSTDLSLVQLNILQKQGRRRRQASEYCCQRSQKQRGFSTAHNLDTTAGDHRAAIAEYRKAVDIDSQ